MEWTIDGPRVGDPGAAVRMAKSGKTTKAKDGDGPATAATDRAASGGDGTGYTVLARRYRSRDFGEVVGQEPIARTLARAIEQDRTAHAYLFCGTRGVGKTSMARIFAKALNASEALDESDAIAQAVLRGEDLDVIEIDGASNRGINEARDLIAGAGLSPTRGRFKIYIIDEVHMLTREAFNALLKTMEEPPSHVKFILCTTDPQKVPATIQSRCQRFDFKAIPTARIAEHLREILGQEGVEAEDDVVQTVASLGNGSMRDALSLLDRLLAGGGDRLTMDVARDMLGLPATELLDRIVQAMVDDDPAAGLTAGAELIAGGATVEAALEMLTGHLRDLMLVVACGSDTELLDLTDDARGRLAAVAPSFDAAGLVYLIATCDAVARNARGSATARALYDAAIVRMCLGSTFGDVRQVLAGAGATSSGGEKKKPELTGRPARAGASSSAAPRGGATRAAASRAPGAPSPAPTRSPAPDAPSVPASAPTPAPVPTPASAPRSAESPSSASPSPPTRPAAPAPAGASAPAPTSPATPPSAPEPTSAPAHVPTDPQEIWGLVGDRIAETPQLASLHRSLEAVSFDGRILLVAPRPGVRGGAFLRARAEKLVPALAEIVGGRPTIDVGLGTAGIDTTPSPADPALIETARDLPLVKEAMELFGATVSEVRPLPERPPRPTEPEGTDA